MPSKYFNLTEISKDDLTWDSSKLELNRFASLLATDDNGEVSFAAEAKYRDSATIEFPNVIIKGLTELFSLEGSVGYTQDDDENNLGSIDYQLSNDDGVTYLYYNAGWVVAGATDFSSEEDIQNNIATFPFVTERQIRIKMRLFPDVDFKATPYVTGVALHYELDFIPEEDVVRSLIDKINNDSEIITEVGVVLGNSANRFEANIDAEILEVIGAYNLTNDPNRLTNIFFNLDKTLVDTKETGEEKWFQRIDLNAAQASGDEIVARIKARIPIYIAPDSDYTFADLPMITLEIDEHVEDNDFRNDGRKQEKNLGRKIARLRDFPTTYRMPIRVLSYSPDDLLATQMNREINRILKDKEIVSRDTGLILKILEEEEFGKADVVRENLRVKVFSLAVIYRDWLGTYEEIPLVETRIFITDIGGKGR